jgi:hypothetical protein
MLRPSRHFDAPAELGDVGFRKAHLERTDRGVVRHGLLLWRLVEILTYTRVSATTTLSRHAHEGKPIRVVVQSGVAARGTV